MPQIPFSYFRSTCLVSIGLCTWLPLCTYAGDALPTPVPLAISGSAPAGITVAENGAIAAIDAQGTVAPTIALEAPVGEAYSIVVWVSVAPSPLLKAKEFTTTTPVTLWDFATEGKGTSQRAVCRIEGGKLTMVEQTDGKWRKPYGIDMEMPTDEWACIAYVREKDVGNVYLNGDCILRTSKGAVAHDQLQWLTFGHFDKTRAFPGQIAQPQLYRGALTRAQVKGIAKNPPATLR